MTPTRYKEAFGTPLTQGMKPQLSSTPSMPKLVPPQGKNNNNNLFNQAVNLFLLTYFFPTDHSFSFLDPKETGLVKVDDIVTHWQDMGVEASSEHDIERIITEVRLQEQRKYIQLSHVCVIAFVCSRLQWMPVVG